MKILIAEDDELMLKTLEFRLKKDGHEILAAKDGQEAIILIDAHEPDLVITDIMMPYFSGIEIVGYIRQNYQQKIKVIVLSGMGQENVILEAFKMGADDYMTKPFSPNELSVRVNRFR